MIQNINKTSWMHINLTIRKHEQKFRNNGRNMNIGCTPVFSEQHHRKTHEDEQKFVSQTSSISHNSITSVPVSKRPTKSRQSHRLSKQCQNPINVISTTNFKQFEYEAKISSSCSVRISRNLLARSLNQ